MAGDWIKVRVDLATCPKVVRMASALKADRLKILGGLLSAWSLFDIHSDDGKLEGYTPEVLDKMIGFDGLSRAMEAVEWLVIGPDFLEIPRFSTHNGASAKRRALDAERKQNVRKMSASEADKTRTREEKRREEINKDTPPAREVEENDDLPGNEDQHHAKRPFDLASLTEEQVIAMADRDLIPKEFAIEQYNAAMGRGGTDWNGVRIQSWRHFIKGEYERSERMKKNANKGNSGLNGGFVNPRHEARKRIEEKDWSKVERF